LSLKSEEQIKPGAAFPWRQLIDHTLLKPETTAAQIEKLCQEALDYSFGAVCVLPTRVPDAAAYLKGSPVKTATVVGFPLGGNTTGVKVLETTQAIAQGAQEIDVVINLGALKDGNDNLVREELQQVVEAAGGSGLPVRRGLARPKVIVKVILETSLLNQEEKIRACLLAQDAGADFVKTSTGFAAGGATVSDVLLMRKTIGPNMGIKASGGIRNLEQVKSLLEAGATRLGTSAGVALVSEWEARKRL
jgi:deoxyribose-phosphate aldolase